MTETKARFTPARHWWRCDICHKFISVGAVRHRECAEDVEHQQRQRRELDQRFDKLLAEVR